jgi:hypothetical protein
MSKYFLEKTDLNNYATSTKDDLLRDFFRFASLAQSHKLYKLYSSGDNIVTQVENQDIIIGRSFLTDSNCDNQNVTKLLSLNCGNFDSGLHQLRGENRYNELRLELINYVDSNNFCYLHLQDLSDDPINFRSIVELGYSGFWIPNLIYSEGEISNLNSGLGTFIKRDFVSTMSKMYISLHQGNLPKITNYTTNVESRDLITLNCSIYQVLINTNKKTILILTNTYISPFSRAVDRLENILQTVRNLIQIKSDMLSDYPDFKITETFTGDMNIYGVNALHGPFGLKASPWSFGLPLMSSMIMGKNIPNERELSKLQIELGKLGYKFLPEINQRNQTISIEVEKYSPNFLKPIFKNKKVGWQLDICILPKVEDLEVKTSLYPFGSFDHSSLLINL